MRLSSTPSVRSFIANIIYTFIDYQCSVIIYTGVWTTYNHDYKICIIANMLIFMMFSFSSFPYPFFAVANIWDILITLIIQTGNTKG